MQKKSFDAMSIPSRYDDGTKSYLINGGICDSSHEKSKRDPVSVLCEYGQSLSVPVSVEIISQTGPPHKPCFKMCAYIGKRQFTVIQASSKRDGRKHAAFLALMKISEEGGPIDMTNVVMPNTIEQTSDGHEDLDDDMLQQYSKNPICLLMEFGQKKNISIVLDSLEKENSRDSLFKVAAIVGEKTFPHAVAPSKKQAKKLAAINALRMMELIGDISSDLITHYDSLKTSSIDGEQAKPKIFKSAISKLVEYGRSNKHNILFPLLSREGPSHSSTFKIRVMIDGKIYSEKSAKSIKEAKVLAAYSALKYLEKQETISLVDDVIVPKDLITGDVEIVSNVPEPSNNPIPSAQKNAVSALFEYCQIRRSNVEFSVVDVSGPPHIRIFTVATYVDSKLLSQGTGKSKREAKIDAANKSLIILSKCHLVEPCDTAMLNGSISNVDASISCSSISSPTRVNISSNTALIDSSLRVLRKNSVSALYEYAQSRQLALDFKILNESGPAHQKKFVMMALVGNREFSQIIASSKRVGRRAAAEMALRQLLSEGEYRTKTDEIPSLKIKELGLFETHFDSIASLAHAKFNSLVALVPDILSGRKVLSAIILKKSENDIGTVISLGTGNRCIAGDSISLYGTVINDSHAEVITRRSFLKFLYRNLLSFNPGSKDSLFESRGNKFTMKDGYSLHLYISIAPCGDGSLQVSRDSINCHQTFERNEDHVPTFASPVHGLLRTKMEKGEGTIPISSDFDTAYQTWDGIQRGERLLTMACSDKICRWNVLGLQGTLLSHFLEPIYLSSITLGALYDHGHLSRAVCCRASQSLSNLQENLPNGYKVNHPELGRISICDSQRETEKTSNMSLNWSLGDSNPEIINGPLGVINQSENTNQNGISEICKKSFFIYFTRLCLKYDRQSLMKHTVYFQAKKNASDMHNEAKSLLFKVFESSNYGKWVKKPAEANLFSVTYGTVSDKSDDYLFGDDASDKCLEEC